MNAEVETLKKDILAKAKKFKYDLKFIQKAIDEATELHKEQFRRSGDPYILHPLAVAYEIITLDLEEDAVAAALLHDTIEDCDITKEVIAERFNPTVALLVEGVTKLDELADNSIQRYTELMNLRKLIISSSSDIRVLLIKLADRLHNMRTISTLNPKKPERKIEYSDETLKVYVPLAEYIGIGKWKKELEDIAFQNREPEIYKLIKDQIEKDQRVYSNILDQLISDLNKVFKGQKLSVKVYGRIKSVYSTYRKVIKHIEEGKINNPEELNISKIKDLLAASVVLDSDEIDCYKVLGLIHSKFEHLSKDFDDYIAKPKPNGYRAIQTTILYKGNTAEIQIKTTEMHEVNEFGPASHVAYKLSGKRNANASSQFSWIRNLTLWREGKKDEVKDENVYKFKAFEDKIFVITPKGKVIELPKDSTPIDFAYLIHSDVGNRFIGAKINGQIGKADTKLQNGDLVEVLTSKNLKRPSAEWIQYALLSSTKQKIRRTLTIHEKEEKIQKGKEIISSYIMKSIKVDWFTIDSGLIRYVLGELGCTDIDQFYQGINFGNISKRDVLKLLIKKLNIQRPEESLSSEEEISHIKENIKNLGGISVEGMNDLEYKQAGCCMPIEGDAIIGLVTLRDGLKIHRKKCPNIISIEDKRILQAEWN